MATDPAELVHAGKSAQNGKIINVYMTCQGGIIGEDRVITHLAIMRYMDVCHDPVVITNPGYPSALRRSAVDGAKLPDNVIGADLQKRFSFALVLFVLGVVPD